MDEDYSGFYMSQLPDAPGAHPGATAEAPPGTAEAPPGTAEAPPGTGEAPRGAPIEATATASPPPSAGDGPIPSPLRLFVGIILGAGLSLLGGWILGEYPFTGVMPYIAGVLFALVIAEVIVSVSRRTYWVTAVAAAVCTVGGLGLGVWISTGRGIDPVPIGGVMALVIGALVALVRGGIRTAGRRATSSQPSS